MSNGTQADRAAGVSDPMPRVPEHELIRCVGAGSYGQVWLARSVLGAWRAVKVVHRRLFRDQRPYEREFLGLQRFEPLSRQDECFVDILQTGRNDEGGYFYYVMELADDALTPSGMWEGDVGRYEPRTLSRVLSSGNRLSLDACLDLGLALCRALGRLHRAGLIHRDVKPSNVIFVDGRPRLADVGLVVEQTEARSWVGTEGYIPPEGPNSPQADLYGLGKVLYVAATGLDRSDFPRLPLGIGATAEGARFLELNAILLRACAAAVDARYATAGEMESDLDLIRAGGSVREQRRLARPARRGTGLRSVLAVAALLAALLVGWWLAGWPGRRSEVAISPSVARGPSIAAPLTAQGLRRMEEGDESAALLYFTEALSAAAVAGEPTRLLRLRIGSIRERLPHLVAAFDAGDEVVSVDLSPDGQRLATADLHGAATVWDVQTGARLHGPHAPAGVPVQVRIAPDGRSLLLVPGARLPAFRGFQKPGGNARVLDLATGRPLAPEMGGVAWGVFSPDGRSLATVAEGNRLDLRSVGSPSAVPLCGDTQPVSWLAFSADGSLLASISMDSTMRLWRVADGAPILGPIALGGVGMLVDFSADGRWISAVAMEPDGTQVLRVWDIASGAERSGPLRFSGGMLALDFHSVRGGRLLAGNEEEWISLLDIEPGLRELAVLSSGKGKCSGWAVSPDGLCAAVGSGDGTVRVWNLLERRPVGACVRQPEAARLICLGSQGSRMVTVARSGAVRVWEIDGDAGEPASVELPGVLANHETPYVPYPAGVMAGANRLLFPMHRHGRVVPVCLEIDTGGEETLPLGEADPPFESLVVGHHAVVAAFHAAGGSPSPTTSGVVLLHRLSGSWRRVFLPESEPLSQIALVDEDRFLLTLNASGVLRRWDVRDGAPLGQLKVHGIDASEPSLSPDGRRVCWFDKGGTRLRMQDSDAAGSNPRTLALPDALAGPPYWQRSYYVSAIMEGWPARDWRSVPEDGLPYPAKAIGRLQIADIHPESKRLLVFGETGFAKSLNLETHTETSLNLESGNIPLASLRFDPSGQLTVAVDTSGGVTVRDADSCDPILPRLLNNQGVRWAVATPVGTVVAGCLPNRILRCKLRSAEETPERLCKEARRLSGRRLDERGSPVWMSPRELTLDLRR